MSKYSREQLRSMAQTVLLAKSADDHRYMMLVIILAERTGLTAKECERRIRAIAGMEAA